MFIADNIKLSDQSESKEDDPTSEEDPKESEAEDDKDAEVVEEVEEDDAEPEMIEEEKKDEKDASLSAARKIHKTIVDTILPQLHKSLIKKVSQFEFLLSVLCKGFQRPMVNHDALHAQ